jgi:predicted unusual protein kinase regulating ubiquinone biosynthesis (AarF/ABC1/UbiB family)
VRSRYYRITWFAARVLLSLIGWDIVLPRLGLRRYADQSRPARLRRIAAEYRRLAIALGGLLIKIGQFLSTRFDVLPPEITEELAGLQDAMPAEDYFAICRVAEAELGAPLTEVLAWFEETPLAAASLGQVHRARLRGPAGGDVVVKVQRPNIDVIAATDLAALRTICAWLKRYPPIRRRVNLDALLAEFTRVLSKELDYLIEGRNADIMAENFRERPDVRIPRVIWAHTTRRVLTLENVLAIKITDYAAITAAGIDRGAVARRLIDVYYKQIFEDGFFHADPHPGNIFVTPLAEPDAQGRGEWVLTFVDFGIADQVPPGMLAGLRELVIGIGSRDAQRMVKAYRMLGMLMPAANLAELANAQALLFERFWGKNMAEMKQVSLQDLQQVALENRKLFQQMPFQMPQNLIFLFRTLAILSGLCAGLDPKFNLWEAFTPYAAKIVQETEGGWRYWLAETGAAGRALFFMPRRLEALLSKVEILIDKAENGDLLEAFVPSLERHLERIEFIAHRLVTALVVTAMLLGGVYLYGAREYDMGKLLIAGAILTQMWVLAHRMMRRLK